MNWARLFIFLQVEPNHGPVLASGWHKPWQVATIYLVGNYTYVDLNLTDNHNIYFQYLKIMCRHYISPEPTTFQSSDGPPLPWVLKQPLKIFYFHWIIGLNWPKCTKDLWNVVFKAATDRRCKILLNWA